MTARQGVHAGADQFGDHGRVVQRETADDTDEGRDVAQHPEHVDAEVVDEQHHHQHRDRAQELHQRAADAAQDGRFRQSSDAEGKADHDREDDSQRGRFEGVDQSRQQISGPGHRVQERRPLLRGELIVTRVGQTTDDQIQQAEDDQTADHGDDPVASPCLRAGGVEQDSLNTHRCTIRRRDRRVKKRPVGRVKITKQAAIRTKIA